MSKPILALLGSNLRTWLSAKGFWLVAASALLPLVLTGAWVATHQANVTIDSIQIDDAELVEGDAVNFTAVVRNTGRSAVGPFNATMAVGTVSGGSLFPEATNTVEIPGLEPGAEHVVNLTWTASPGKLYVVAIADSDQPEDDLGEIDEYDNQNATPILVKRALPAADSAPKPPATLGGDDNATNGTVDLAVTGLSLGAGPIEPRVAREFTVTVTNNGAAAVTDARVQIRAGSSFGTSFLPSATEDQLVTLQPGESTSVPLTWTPPEGAYWLEAWIEPPAGAKEATVADNHQTQAFTVDPRITEQDVPPDPPEKLTIKQFYLNVLSLLHFRILLPLVALFYAAGVIADEKERGSLPYVLTRPLPRWLIPITKFVASFAVATVAVLVGLLLTFVLLFGTTTEGGDVGFFTTPVIVGLLTLFVYGAIFTLMGVWVQRPYLVGVAFVLGWENAASIFVPWVRNLTVTQHVSNALAGWPLDKGLQWLPDASLPEGPGARTAVWILLGVAAACLVAASTMMKKREFEV